MSSPLILPLSAVTDAGLDQAGAKALSLARLAQARLPVPSTLCVTAAAYRRFLRQTGIDRTLTLELDHPSLRTRGDDALRALALRLRTLFLQTPLPRDLERDLALGMPEWLGREPLAVRSSAVDADDPERPGGLHDSLVNVQGAAELLQAIVRIWASLWSDRALETGRAMGWDLRDRAMAVLVQPMVEGRCSGRVISHPPEDPETVLVEAAWGLNAGLAEGTVPPDRWRLDRDSGAVLRHEPAPRRLWSVPTHLGAAIQPVPPALDLPPLAPSDLKRLHQLALQLDDLFAAPQEAEFTLVAHDPVLLQCRSARLLSRR